MRLLLSGVLLLASAASPALAQTVSTVAGNGTPVHGGYGGPATDAGVVHPGALSVIRGGGYYIGAYSALLKVNASGTITLIAGNGTPGFSGDNGPASAASVSHYVFGLAQGPDGSVYFSDWLNHRVRKVDPNGIITTVAGNGVNASNGDGGAATSAAIGGPAGLEFDSAGNFYIAQYGLGLCRVRKVDVSGIISTFAGTGACTSGVDGGSAASTALNNPFGLRFDANGNMFVSEYDGDRIRKISPTGTVSTFVASTNGPTHIDFDSAGNLYIAEYFANTIRKVTSAGISSVFAGNGARASSGDGGPALSASFHSPVSVAVGEGRIYVDEHHGHRIRAITADVSPLLNRPSLVTSCASEGYSGTKLLWCQNICEKGYTGATLSVWIHRWILRYRDLPHCAAD